MITWLFRRAQIRKTFHSEDKRLGTVVLWPTPFSNTKIGIFSETYLHWMKIFRTSRLCVLSCLSQPCPSLHVTVLGRAGGEGGSQSGITDTDQDCYCGYWFTPLWVWWPCGQPFFWSFRPQKELHHLAQSSYLVWTTLHCSNFCTDHLIKFFFKYWLFFHFVKLSQKLYLEPLSLRLFQYKSRTCSTQ